MFIKLYIAQLSGTNAYYIVEVVCAIIERIVNGDHPVEELNCLHHY